MQYYEDNENAVVNTEPTTSETPSNLVEEKDEGLSPNPAGFGFTKQLVVDSLPDIGAFDTLYLLRVYDGNGNVKEYYKYRWTYDRVAGAEGRPTQPHWERVFEPVNNVKHEDGPHETPVQENTAPRKAPEKVFNGEVAFNEEPSVKGKPLHEWVEKAGEGIEFDGEITVMYSNTIWTIKANDLRALNVNFGVYLLKVNNSNSQHGGILAVNKSGGGSSPVRARLSGVVFGHSFDTGGEITLTANNEVNLYKYLIIEGRLPVEYTVADGYYIDSLHIPEQSGLYKLYLNSDGKYIGVLSIQKGTQNYVSGLFNDKFFSGIWEANNSFIITNKIQKRLYKHVLTVHVSSSGSEYDTINIISNIANAAQSMGGVVTIFDSAINETGYIQDASTDSISLYRMVFKKWRKGTSTTLISRAAYIQDNNDVVTCGVDHSEKVWDTFVSDTVTEI